jgi:hypothetical protein
MNDLMAQIIRQGPKQNNQVPAASQKLSLPLFIFGLIWCGGVGAFDHLALPAIFHQTASTWFKAAPAHIVKSEMTSHSNSDGTTHGVAFEYTYSVGGAIYTGNRFTFDKSSSSDRAWARQAVADFPAGSERVCYYDPRDPSRAVLSPGLHGSDITRILFFTPFNIVAGFLIAYAISTWRERNDNAVAPRVADRLHNREAFAMSSYSPVVTFFAMLLLTSFIGIFAVVIPGGFHPSLAKSVTVCALAFAISVVVTLHIRQKMRAGAYDLIFDDGAKTIALPATHKRATRELIPFADAQSFEVAKIDTGTGEDRTVRWHLTLQTRQGASELLNIFYSEADARRFANAFNAKLAE